VKSGIRVHWGIIPHMAGCQIFFGANLDLLHENAQRLIACPARTIGVGGIRPVFGARHPTLLFNCCPQAEIECLCAHKFTFGNKFENITAVHISGIYFASGRRLTLLFNQFKFILLSAKETKFGLVLHVANTLIPNKVDFVLTRLREND
jgi:hypothetical protein